MKRASGHPVVVTPGMGVSALAPVDLNEDGFSEEALQQLIDNHPEILPIHEIEGGFGRPIAVCREMPTAHGPIDNLLVTPEGNIVLVETKLWRNPEARRKVVAQALDYASCLFEMTYEDFEAAALKGLFGRRAAPKRLYDLFEVADAAPESVFIEAVETNLRRGRALILVVGDGVRLEAKRLSDLLQAHAGAHFTFALVELSLYRLGESIIVCPRTLMKTELVERGIVVIDDHRAKVTLPFAATKPTVGSPRGKNVTAEQFYESIANIDPNLPGKIQALLDDLAPIGVYPEFLASLNLRWDPQGKGPLNLGYIERNGVLWVFSKMRGLPDDFGERYVEATATALGSEVNKGVPTTGWYVAKKSKPVRIKEITEQLPNWKAVIETFQARVTEYLANEPNG